MTKQVIVLRKDLNMRKGKMVAQGAHASGKAAFIDRLSPGVKIEGHPGLYHYEFTVNEIENDWLTNIFTKICVSVNSEAELLEIHKKAQEAQITTALVKDAGKTEFKEPTYTAVAVGPGDAEEIDKITGNLPLL